jgi:hypothetical protein
MIRHAADDHDTLAHFSPNSLARNDGSNGTEQEVYCLSVLPHGVMRLKSLFRSRRECLWKLD